MTNEVDIIDLCEESPRKGQSPHSTIDKNNVNGKVTEQKDAHANGFTEVLSNIDDDKLAATELQHSQQALMQGCFLLQLSVLQEQLELVDTLRTKAQSPRPQHAFSRSLPPLLVSRQAASREKNVIDDFEEILLHLLDHDGRITLRCKVNSFILLMNMTVKLEHLVMCIYVLLHKFSLGAQEWFVLDGGLRVLRRWVQQSLRADRIALLYQIVDLCRKLPFDLDSVRISEIGKAVKRILKHKSPVCDTAPLFALVQTLVDEWKQHAANKTCISRSKTEITESFVSTKSLPSIVYDMDSYITIYQHREKEIEQDIVNAFTEEDTQATQVEEDAMLIADIDQGEQNEVIEVQSDSKVSENGVAAGDDRLSNTSPVSMDVDETHETNVSLPEKSNPIPEVSTIISVPTVSSTVSFASSPRVSIPSKLPLSVVLMQQREAQNQQILSSPKSPATSALKTPIPALKRKREDTPQEPAEKKTVRWADQFNQRLCETRIVEVQRVGRSVAHYRSIKDLVRREKQQEKSAHLEKIQVGMQPTIAWARPQLLKIPEGVHHNIARKSETAELKAQQERTQKIQEIFYDGDILIPRYPADISDGILISRDGPPPKRIWWTLPEEEVSPAVAEDISALMEALPECLRALDANILNELVQDDELVKSLLNDDGTVNEERVRELHNNAMPKPSPAKPAFGKRHRGTFSDKSENSILMPDPGWTSPSPHSSRPLTHHAPTSPHRTHGNERRDRHREDSFGRMERRPPPPPLVSTKDDEVARKRAIPCKYFSKSGTCRFGNGCHFGHFVAK